MKYTATLREIDTDAIIRLKFHKKDLTYQQYHTLRGQVLAGDTEGAMKGLKKLLRRNKR